MATSKIDRLEQMDEPDQRNFLALVAREREQHIRQMVANNRLEGIEPDGRDLSLHQAYIDGTATLDDLHNHAIEFAMEHMEDDGQAAKAHLAAGRPITYCDDLYPDTMIRKWPDGRRELIEVDDQGNITIIGPLP